MDHRVSCGDTAGQGSWCSAWRAVRRVGGGIVGLGLMGAFLVEGTSFAQDKRLRLNVRPHEMATGKRTERAGWFEVDSTSMMVYVPQHCVGSRRCPLLLNSNTPEATPLVQVADKYGMIVATMDLGSYQGKDHPIDSAARANLDQGIKKLLRTLAIDPAKIALLGRGATADETNEYGSANLNVFSRIVVFTQHISHPPVKSPQQKNEYYIAGGFIDDMGASNFGGVWLLREFGYPVKHTIQFRGNVFQQEDYNFMGHWLLESWAIPDPKGRPAPQVFGDPPLLTTEIMSKMTVFWTNFTQEPDSIKTTARMAHVREVVLSLGSKQISTLMVDMSALAAKSPSVASALRAAGLTPQEHDIYRAALASAFIVLGQGRSRGGSYTPGVPLGSVNIGSNSTLAKNAQFLAAHPNESEALFAARMWNTP